MQKRIASIGSGGLMGYGAPDLRLDGVLAGAQKALDAPVLLDPLEKQFHLPAVLVQRSDGQGRQRPVVCQKKQRHARLRILEADAAQILGVVFGDVKAVPATLGCSNREASQIGKLKFKPWTPMDRLKFPSLVACEPLRSN
jgi:hypothetical protein